MNQTRDVIRLIDSGEPMAVEELQRAADVLGALGSSGRREELVARVRVAFALERLTRVDAIP